MVDFAKLLAQRSANKQRTDCRIDLVDGALAITSPYSAEFVADLKATIPASDRKWDGQSKRWMVSPQFGSQLQRLIERHYGCTVSLPQATGRAPLNEMRLLDVRYIGAAKTREDGAESAFGWSNGEWSVIFPKPVLLEWFGQTARPGESSTLYGVLGVSQDVKHEDLRKAWKRLILQWHPDRAKESDAPEQFRAIQEAYEVLSDSTKRAKYDVGLHFQALTQSSKNKRDDFASPKTDWRAPLRCGLILAEGQSQLGRFVVSRILQWADVVNAKGEILITTWPAGKDKFSESWVMP